MLKKTRIVGELLNLIGVEDTDRAYPFIIQIITESWIKKDKGTLTYMKCLSEIAKDEESTDLGINMQINKTMSYLHEHGNKKIINYILGYTSSDFQGKKSLYNFSYFLNNIVSYLLIFEDIKIDIIKFTQNITIINENLENAISDVVIGYLFITLKCVEYNEKEIDKIINTAKKITSKYKTEEALLALKKYDSFLYNPIFFEGIIIPAKFCYVEISYIFDDSKSSVRINNCLARAGIYLFKDLYGKTKDDLLKVRNLGIHSYENFIMFLKKAFNV